jgi:hypothetical protein
MATQPGALGHNNGFDEKKVGDNVDPERASLETSSLGKTDLLGAENVDPVLSAKMHLVNDAIDEIGFTPYQAKLFCLNGFGCVRSFLSFSRPVAMQFNLFLTNQYFTLPVQQIFDRESLLAQFFDLCRPISFRAASDVCHLGSILTC